MKKIRVRCINGFKISKRNIKYAEVIENKEYIAVLCEESGEFFAKDDKGHKFFVGELDIEGNLELDKDFMLINQN